MLSGSVVLVGLLLLFLRLMDRLVVLYNFKMSVITSPKFIDLFVSEPVDFSALNSLPRINVIEDDAFTKKLIVLVSLECPACYTLLKNLHQICQKPLTSNISIYIKPSTKSLNYQSILALNLQQLVKAYENKFESFKVAEKMADNAFDYMKNFEESILSSFKYSPMLFWGGHVLNLKVDIEDLYFVLSAD